MINLLGLHLTAAADDFGAADQDGWVYAERPADKAENDHRADAETAATNRHAHPAARHAEAATAIACIVNIVTAAKIIPTHVAASSLRSRKQYKGAAEFSQSFSA
jgi:hypothetical protein